MLKGIFLRTVLASATLMALVSAPVPRAKRLNELSRLARYSAKAKAQGQTSMVIWEAEEDCWSPQKNLNSTLEGAVAVIATPLLQRTAVTGSGSEISTFTKYRIAPTLAKAPPLALSTSEPLREDIPRAMLPIRDNEFILIVAGGTAMVDGIELTVKRPRTVANLMSVPRQLLFLRMQAGGRIALPALELDSVYAFEPGKAAVPLANPPKGRLAAELSQLGSDPLAKLIARRTH